MDERVSAAIVEILGYVKQTADFAADQAPLVAQEMVRWGIADNLFWLGWWLVCLYLIRLGFSARAAAVATDDFDEFFSVITISALWTATLASVFGVFCAASMIVKCIVSPRLYILGEFAKMAGGGQ